MGYQNREIVGSDAFRARESPVAPHSHSVPTYRAPTDTSRAELRPIAADAPDRARPHRNQRREPTGTIKDCGHGNPGVGAARVDPAQPIDQDRGIQ
jgi:hypothetical protein